MGRRHFFPGIGTFTRVSPIKRVQAQQRKAVIADRLRQAGIPVSHNWRQLSRGGAQQAACQSASGASAGADGAAEAGDSGSTGWVDLYLELRQGCQQYGQPAASGRTGGRSGSQVQGDVCLDLDAAFNRWLKQTSGEHLRGPECGPLVAESFLHLAAMNEPCRHAAEGRSMCLTPSHWGAKLAPQLTPKQSAEIYTGLCRQCSRDEVHTLVPWWPPSFCRISTHMDLPVLLPLRACRAGCRNYVSREALEEVKRWAKFAAAAYGSMAYIWNQPK